MSTDAPAATADGPLLSAALAADLAGYDRGEMARLAEEGSLDHCFTVGSQSTHRTQESQARIGHRLWQLAPVALEGAS